MRAEPDRQTDALANAVIGAAIEVHRMLGPGYLEGVYEESLAIELGLRGIPFERQKSVAAHYKGRPVGEGRLDMLVGGRLVVELKAVDALAPIHTAQVMSYLKTTGLLLGLLINFHVPLLKRGDQESDLLLNSTRSRVLPASLPPLAFLAPWRFHISGCSHQLAPSRPPTYCFGSLSGNQPPFGKA